MRQLAIAVLGISLVTASAAQADFGKVKSPSRNFNGTGGPLPASTGAPNYGVPAPKPYKPYTPPTQMKPLAPIGSTDGGELFKPYRPYQPKSVFGPPDEPKAGKRKSLYDR